MMILLQSRKDFEPLVCGNIAPQKRAITSLIVRIVLIANIVMKDPTMQILACTN